MTKLLTVKNIFQDKIFRVPDYQRGYSWEKTHLEAFWNDLQNLQADHIHYTGMISVKKTAKKLLGDKNWLVEQGFEPYFVVDGQQRLTTIVILLWCIAEKIGAEEILPNVDKECIINTFIYKNGKNVQDVYLFGYEVDNPSFHFLINKVFEQSVEKGIKIIDTAYTNSLMESKSYFVKKLKEMEIVDIGDLYKKITTKLKFDFKILEEELDIFVVFETMNNRGKPLSDLEKLKNRLIYLSSILPQETDDRRDELRTQINKAWQTIYYYLGRNKQNKLNDDTFLQNHWIAYHRYERREAKFYEKDIFERIFTVNNVVEKNNQGEYITDYNRINNYVKSIERAAEKWFLIKNPTHEEAIQIEPNEEIKEWLQRLDRLGLRNFSPLILAIFSEEFTNSHDDENGNYKRNILELLENYIFLLFCVSYRRANTGTYHFMGVASGIYNGNLDYQQLKSDLSNWIKGDDYSNGYFDVENFYKTIEILFERHEKFGYTDWSWLKYFLAEYEAYLSKKPLSKTSYGNLKIDIIHYDKKLDNGHNHRSKKQKKLCYSLGNIILIEKQLDKQLDFSKKREDYIESKLRQVNEIGECQTWGSEDILLRGKKLIQFLKDRWNVDFDMPDEKLLFLDFLEE
jgi:uncharacterized protein with ParB-like and HNH nuclease domain